jgi:DNA-binding phage protein
MARRKTGFDRYVGKRMKSREFAEAYGEARREIDVIDAIVRLLDAERERAHLTKAELARRAGIPAETVRKLFTAAGSNPTMSTISRLAAELGLTLELVKR